MKSIVAVLLVLMTSCPAFSAAARVPANNQIKSGASGLIDDFNDGEYKKNPEWWVFDNINLKFIPGKNSRYALQLKGTAKDWYVGGVGIYLAKDGQDLSRYTTIDMDIYGSGPESGTLKIELYDDDNGNWQIEQDPKKGYAPIYDDRFAYELKVDWNGWKHVLIPLSEFVDNNPEAGDNVWNPQQSGGSGGLLQLQLIAVATSKTGKINLALDNLEFKENNRGQK